MSMFVNRFVAGLAILGLVVVIGNQLSRSRPRTPSATNITNLDGSDVAYESTEGFENPPSSEHADGSESQISLPTHQQVATLRPKRGEEILQLHGFFTSPQGRLLTVCSSKGSVDTNAAPSPGYVIEFTSTGEQSVLCNLAFLATAITTAPDGSIFVAGDGKIAHLSSSGELIKDASSPSLGDAAEMQKKAEAGVEAARNKYTRAYEVQIKALNSRIEAITRKSPENRSRAEQVRLTAYEKQLASIESTVREYDISIESMMAKGKRITAVAANETDVFVSCALITESGYGIWRINHNLQEPKTVVSRISGCCGQMDVQCWENGFVLAENCSFKVGYYDRDGNSVSAFGKGDRQSQNGFGGCCNPMNLHSLPNGNVLTAESSIGHIKCFDRSGDFVSYIGKASIGGGCKHCSLGFDPNSDRYYMMHEDDNSICVLGRMDSEPEKQSPVEGVASLSN